MWIETLIMGAAVAVVLVVLGLVVSRRVTSTRSRDEDLPGVGSREQPGRAWTAAGPVAAAFPVERTPHERNVGDAAFVDGFVIGHYLAPPRTDRDPARADRSGLASVMDGADEPVDVPTEVVIDDGPPSSVHGDPLADPLSEPADPEEDLDLDADVGDGARYDPSSWDDSSDDEDDGVDDEGFDGGFGFDDGFDNGFDDDW